MATTKIIKNDQLTGSPVFFIDDVCVEENNKKSDIIVFTDNSYTFQNLQFQINNAIIHETSYTELDKLVGYLMQNAKVKIQISGYTDNVGKAQDNIVLSEARANAVKKYLTDKGIDINRIITKGNGSGNPIASNDTEEGRTKNRRVEMMVLKNE